MNLIFNIDFKKRVIAVMFDIMSIKRLGMLCHSFTTIHYLQHEDVLHSVK